MGAAMIATDSNTIKLINLSSGNEKTPIPAENVRRIELIIEKPLKVM